MTNPVTTASGPAAPARGGIPHRTLAIVFFVLAAAGLIGSWYFNLQYTGSPSGYLKDWFANTASSAIATDALVAGIAAAVLIVVEGGRIGLAVWARAILVLASFTIAVSFAFPLFLGIRELKLAERS